MSTILQVELVKICKPESSDKEHHDMVADAEEILRNLKLPYRKLLLCSGDVGFSARLCYDLEVWLPSQQIYREVSSISNCHDFQSRRMKLRCRPEKKSDEKVHPHTINGSGVAIGRALVAILENYQNSDGSVTIPEQLVPYMGGLTILQHKKTTVKTS
jgi:seryl-tRNA synthetase